MHLKKVQNDVEEWTGQYTPQYWPPFEQFARLVEEVGELSRELNHTFGNKKKKAGEHEGSMADELADIIFTIACLANATGIDLDVAWEKLMSEKQYGRDKNRYTKKEK